MKVSVKYKLFGTFMILFVMAISFLFGFLVAPSRTNGNMIYWFFKAICLIWLALMILLLWLRKSSFSKFVPIVLIAISAQLIPSLSRIGFKGENPMVPSYMILISVIIIFILSSISILLLIAHEKYQKDENRAIPSSNSKKD